MSLYLIWFFGFIICVGREDCLILRVKCSVFWADFGQRWRMHLET